MFNIFDLSLQNWDDVVDPTLVAEFLWGDQGSF